MRPRHTAAENCQSSLGGACRSAGFNEAAAYSRGKPTTLVTGRTNTACFNEAAAYSRGKPSKVGRYIAKYLVASMRPRHTAAENTPTASTRAATATGFNEAAAYSRGKPPERCSRTSSSYPASMRPRHTAAENVAHRPWSYQLRVTASMRPRHTAAENRRTRSGSGSCTSSFNEAAAYSRGKPRHRRRHDPGDGPASMRPRHTAAENLRGERVTGAEAEMLQ